MKQYGLLLLFSCLFSQWSWAINPLREYLVRPEDFGLTYEEVKVETPDGYRLNTWVLQPQGEVKRQHTFILAGSDAGNMGQLLTYASFLLRAGFPVITFDYRGFGDSSDFAFHPDNYYYPEYIQDFVTVVDWVKAEQKPEKIAVLAFSMGTLIASAGYTQSPYDLLVGEAFVRSPHDIAQRVKMVKGKEIVLPAGARKAGKRIRQLDIPILLFAGTSDEITTLEDSRAIATGKPNRWVVPFEGEHLRGAFALGWENYIQEIISMTH